MKQVRHTPLYVPANSMGQAAGHAAEFFHGLWRAVVCLSVLVVLLAGVAYAEDPEIDPVEWIDIQDVLDQQSEDQYPAEDLQQDPDPESGIDPPDPDYGGTADQDPAAGWIDPGYVPDVDYGVQPYSSSTPWYWSSTDISAVVNAANTLNGGTNNAGSLYRITSKLDSIATNTAKAGIDYSSKLDTLIANTASTGPIVGHIDFVYDRLGDIYSRLGTTNTKLDTANTRLNSLITLVTGTNSRLDNIFSLLTSGSVRILSNTFAPIADENIIFSSLLPSNQSVQIADSNGTYDYFYRIGSSTGTFYFSRKTITPSGNQLWDISSVSTFKELGYAYTSSPITISPGSYTAVFYIVASGLTVNAGNLRVALLYDKGNSVFPATYNLQSRPDSSQSSVVIMSSFSIREPLSFWGIASRFTNIHVESAYVYCFLYRNSDIAFTDNAMSDSVNSGQAGATQQLQQAVNQTEQFEQQMFQDVSTYTSQLNFGLGDWAEAAAGISYIGSVFMLIWDNSPVQPIILSLMLGLCMLLLGRGARVADAASRSTSEERASIHQGKGRGS